MPRSPPVSHRYRLEAGRWLELGTWGDETEARIEPFEEIAVDVSSWWA